MLEAIIAKARGAESGTRRIRHTTKAAASESRAVEARPKKRDARKRHARRPQERRPRRAKPSREPSERDDLAPGIQLLTSDKHHEQEPTSSCSAAARPGAEAEFGACAERHGIEEVNFTFDGHTEARRRGVRVLNHEELQAGDVSLEYVSRLMHRRYTDSPTIRKVLQSLWYQVNNGQEIYVVGVILEDGTVRGGTGWGAEFAKLCNKPLFVFDQDKDGWFEWTGDAWKARSGHARHHPPALHRHRAPAASTTTASARSRTLFTKSFE